MNKYDYAFWFGIAVWALETWLFGFNDTAQSNPERLLDVVSLVAIVYGCIGSWLATFRPVISINVGEGAEVTLKQ